MPQTTEYAFESYIEKMMLRDRAGWLSGAGDKWDVDRALFPERSWSFLRATQPKLWAEMHALHGAGLEPLLLNTLVKELDLKGSLNVLRHGFKFYGKTFRLAYFKPAHGLNDEVLEQYARNQLTLTRQVLCHPGKGHTVDMLFALNGIPVATCELKNPGTGQPWRNAVAQYQTREPNAPLFAFKSRALVHFAADPDEVHMTTRLTGGSTLFLPFNRGSHPGEVQCGAGNPQHASGYRGGYFWEDVLQRDSFLDIFGNFMFVEKTDEKVDDGHGGQRRVTKATMIFPRYHQLDAVRKLIGAARHEGTGRNYLSAVARSAAKPELFRVHPQRRKERPSNSSAERGRRAASLNRSTSTACGRRSRKGSFSTSSRITRRMQRTIGCEKRRTKIRNFRKRKRRGRSQSS